MSNQQGPIVSGELGIPGPVIVTDTLDGRILNEYTLVAIVQETTYEKVRDEWDPTTKQQVVLWTDVTRAKYVLRKDEESAIAGMIRKVGAAQCDKNCAENAKRVAERQAEEHSRDAAKAQEQLRVVDSQLERIRNELSSSKSRNQVMENDLAKLRCSLGEIRMKEILETGG